MNTDESSPEYRVQKARNIAGLLFWINENALNYEINEELIKAIHREVMTGQLQSDAVGEYRQCPVYLKFSSHKPPHFNEVPAYVEQLVTKLTRMEGDGSSLTFKMAYVLWAFNWVHPFLNGNGRTARLLAHYIFVRHTGSNSLSMHLEEHLREVRSEYFKALQVADDSFAKGRIDLSSLEALIARFFDQIVDQYP